MNVRDYPLQHIKAVAKIKSEVRKLVKDNSKLLKISDDYGEYLKVVETNPSSYFYYEIIQSHYKNSRISFDIMKRPSARNTIEPGKNIIDIDKVVLDLTNWLNILKDYDKISLSPDEEKLNFYEEEYYNDFVLLDDDADTNPFDIKRQLLLDQHLEEISQILEENKDKFSIESVIKETSELRENITKYTKQETLTRLSKIYAKIRLAGISLLKQFGKKALDFGIKKIISGGYDSLGNLL